MDIEEFLYAFELERNGKLVEAEALIRKLAAKENPFALFELAMRHRPDCTCSDCEWSPEKNMEAATSYANQALAFLQKEVEQHNADAMRYLGAVYCGHYWPEFKNFELVEPLWLKAYEHGCFLAANELFTLHQNTDSEKAAHWYRELKKHNCQVVYHPAYEPPEI